MIQYKQRVRLQYQNVRLQWAAMRRTLSIFECYSLCYSKNLSIEDFKAICIIDEFYVFVVLYYRAVVVSLVCRYLLSFEEIRIIS